MHIIDIALKYSLKQIWLIQSPKWPYWNLKRFSKKAKIVQFFRALTIFMTFVMFLKNVPQMLKNETI